MSDPIPTKAELEVYFPLGRNPKSQPRMMDEFDTPSGVLKVVGSIGRSRDDRWPLLVVFDRNGERYAVTTSVWKREMIWAHMRVWAENTIPESWKVLLGDRCAASQL